MPLVMSYPFRLAPDGGVAVVDQSSEEADRDELAMLALTIAGERPLRPGYGLPDPTFGGFSPPALVAGAARFGPPVVITAVDVAVVDQSTQRVRVAFR